MSLNIEVPTSKEECKALTHLMDVTIRGAWHIHDKMGVRTWSLTTSHVYYSNKILCLLKINYLISNFLHLTLNHDMFKLSIFLLHIRWQIIRLHKTSDDLFGMSMVPKKQTINRAKVYTSTPQEPQGQARLGQARYRPLGHGKKSYAQFQWFKLQSKRDVNYNMINVNIEF